MTELISSFVKYRQKRAEIRARQRAELEQELRPFLKDFGQAILEEQKNGKRIEDIEYAIGAKNRTLVYAAKRAAKDVFKAVAPTTPEEPVEPSEPRWTATEVEYNDFGNHAWSWVTIDDKVVQVSFFEGDALIPDEWALDTENASLYREIIKHIKAQL